MSRQTYVDDHLMSDIEGNHLPAAAIIQSATFPQLKPEEVSAIVKNFEDPRTLAPTGLYLGGTKYMVIQGEPGAVIRGKKGSGGVTVKKNTLAVLISIYDEPMTYSWTMQFDCGEAWRLPRRAGSLEIYRHVLVWFGCSESKTSCTSSGGESKHVWCLRNDDSGLCLMNVKFEPIFHKMHQIFT